MLVRTPAHRSTESLLGYVLRLSETNGYDTPWHVLSHAGIGQGVMLTAGFPVDCLAKVLGRTAEDLAGIAYSTVDAEGRREFRLLGHSLGHGLNTTPLRLIKPAICPHCVAEHGHIDAFFDLNLAVACPHHRCELLTNCPACAAPLSWFRPGLLTCKCGASLADANTPDVSDELADLMGILWAVLHRHAADSLDMHSRWPVHDMLDTPLRALALKLPDLGSFQCRAMGLDADDASPKELLIGAARALSNWPQGFHAFLNRLSAVGDGNQHTFGKRYELFSKRFFSTRPCGKDFIWLRDEFVRYGLRAWNESVIDHKLLREVQDDRRYVSKTELARRLKVSQATLVNWVKSGRIELRVRKVNGHLRYVADTEDPRIQTPEYQEGAVLCIREASAYVGLPVSVLTNLKASGQFTIKHQAQQKKGFHQADLDNFKLQLAAVPIPSLLAVDDGLLVSLAQVLGEYRFHAASNKADFVVAYLSGRILAVRRDSGEPQDIFFRKADVDTFVSDSRRQSAGGSHSLRDAAKLIGCDPIVIPNLISAGYLEKEDGREGSRIVGASLECFMDERVSICGLAREWKTTSSRLLRLCETGCIPLTQVARNSGVPTSFIRREDLETLRRLATTFPARQPSGSDESRTLTAVRLYLAELKELGNRLPRRGGKPQRRAIAKACGIDRSAFYNNPEIVRLVDAYAAAE